MVKSSKGLKSALKSQQTRLKVKEKEKAVQAAQLVAQRSSKKGGKGSRAVPNAVAGASSGSSSSMAGRSLKGKEKARELPKRPPTIPFSPTDKILLIGEGNFSFARALVCDPPSGLEHLPAINITATAYDTEEECFSKYHDAEAIVGELRSQGMEVLFGVDATKLEKVAALKKRRWNKIVWNFPHAGKGIADQDRNILSNQKLILGFLRSAARHLVLGPKPEPPKKKKKKGSDDDEEEEDSEQEEDDDDMDVTLAAPSSRGTVLITLRNVVPYTQWDVPRLAKSPPQPTGSESPNPKYVLQRSFQFHREIWKGYGHRMTKGERAHGTVGLRLKIQFAGLLRPMFSFAQPPRIAHLPSAARCYAISVVQPKKLPGKSYPRVFKDKKAFQYNWYSRILKSTPTSPLIFLHHNEFTAERLQALRSDIVTAYNKVKPSLSDPKPISGTQPSEPTLTVVRTSIFGAALRDLPGVNMKEVSQMLNNQKGSFAVLSLPTLDPPRLAAVLRAMDRSVPPKPPKTDAEIKAELEAKDADPQQPGKRMKRVRPIRVPELKLMGAIVENRVFVPQQVEVVSKLPTLDTLRAQIVGLLSAPASQLAAVLSEASGGKLARTLEGLKKGLEEDAEGSSPPS